MRGRSSKSLRAPYLQQSILNISIGRLTMHAVKYVSVTVALVLGTSALVFAQAGSRRGGGNYNPATEVTFSGIVDEVQRIPAPARGPGGVHLLVRSETVVHEVHLGPAAYLASKHFDFGKGDAITVTGSKVKMGGQDVVIAREIKKGDQVLTLRDARGFPLWSGRARRSS
jgi:hypothetical protein